MKTMDNCSVVLNDKINHVVVIGRQTYCNGSRVPSTTVLKESLLSAGYTVDTTLTILRKVKQYARV